MATTSVDRARIESRLVPTKRALRRDRLAPCLRGQGRNRTADTRLFRTNPLEKPFVFHRNHPTFSAF